MDHFRPANRDEKNRIRKKWNLGPEDAVIGIVSKLWEGKGHATLIDAVKILAESPLTKDMLESNLNQLKADLQAQGLKVDQLDVSVAHDSHSGAHNQTAAQQSKSGAARGEADSEENPSAESLESQAGESETTAENAIDFFA